MNMQQIMIQAQKMKREMEKAQNALKEKEFEIEKNGAIKVVMLGDYSIKSISIDEDAMDKENKEMIEELLTLAINEIKEKIDAESDAINSKLTGNMGGFGF